MNMGTDINNQYFHAQNRPKELNDNAMQANEMRMLWDNSSFFSERFLFCTARERISVRGGEGWIGLGQRKRIKGLFMEEMYHGRLSRTM